MFIPAKNAKFQDIKTQPKKVDHEEEEKVDTSKPGRQSHTSPVDQPMGEEEKTFLKDGRTSDCTHGPKGKCLH